MAIDNENIVGAVNELLELFKKQQVITNQFLNSNEIDHNSLNKEREEIDKISGDFEFLANYILENVSVEDNHRYIGKMLLNARQQAEEILNEARAEDEKIKNEARAEVEKIKDEARVEVEKIKTDNVVEAAAKVIEEPEEEQPTPVPVKEEKEQEEEIFKKEEPIDEEEVVDENEVSDVLPVEATELSSNHLHKTQEIHQKYKDSLDSILKEIDVFLER